MGTWGKGNFDDDTAADHLSVVTARLIGEIDKALAGSTVEIEPDEYWGVAVPCNLELLHLIGRQEWVGATLPDLETIEAWKAKYLAVWDASIDALEPSRDFKKGRREVIARTFDQLADLVEELGVEADAPRPKPIAKPGAKPQPKPAPQAKAKAKAQPKAKATPQPKAKAKAQPKAKAKAQPKAKAKAPAKKRARA